MTPKFNPTAAHHLIASWILTIYSLLQDDHETSTEWQFKGHIYFEAGRWPAGKTYDNAGEAVEEQFLPTVPVPVHSMEIFNNLEQNPTGNC